MIQQLFCSCLFMVSFFLRLQSEEEPDVVLVKVEEGTRQTSLSIQEGELMLVSAESPPLELQTASGVGGETVKCLRPCV